MDILVPDAKRRVKQLQRWDEALRDFRHKDALDEAVASNHMGVRQGLALRLVLHVNCCLLFFIFICLFRASIYGFCVLCGWVGPDGVGLRSWSRRCGVGLGGAVAWHSAT